VWLSAWGLCVGVLWVLGGGSCVGCLGWWLVVVCGWLGGWVVGVCFWCGGWCVCGWCVCTYHPYATVLIVNFMAAFYATKGLT